MMRSAGGALAVAVAALLVCCSADPHQDQDGSASEHSSGDHYDIPGPKTVEQVNGGNVRKVREVRHSGYVPYLLSTRYQLASPYRQREMWPLTPIEYGGYYGFGLPKRNFDEIDRSGLDTLVQKRNGDEIVSPNGFPKQSRSSLDKLVKKRNFDEIDASSIGFPNVFKRFSEQSDLDSLVKRNFDEIDASSMGFPYVYRRFNQPSGLDAVMKKRNFDEIDASSFGLPYVFKRVNQHPFTDPKRGQLAEHPMDEIDLSSIPIGSQRSLDSYPAMLGNSL